MLTTNGSQLQQLDGNNLNKSKNKEIRLVNTHVQPDERRLQSVL